MAKNTHRKKARRAVAAPANEPNNDHSRTLAGNRITQLTDLDKELAALADMTLAHAKPARR